MELHQLAAFLSASILITLAPGPDVLYLLATSIAFGKKSGAALSLGLCSGLVFHTFLVAVGVAALIQSSPLLFQLLKYLGAGYLLYLAWCSWIARNSQLALTTAAVEPPGKLYRRGLIMNMVNPKVLIFFLAFLPQFIDPAGASSTLQILLLGFLFGLQACLLFLGISVLSEAIRQKVLSRAGFSRHMAQLQTLILASISLALLCS